MRGRRLRDLTGMVFGRLTVLRLACPRIYPTKTMMCWECACDCGAIVEVLGGNLTTGNSVSCGCFRKEVSAARMLVHGHSRGRRSTRTYEAWKGLLDRCRNPKNPRYNRYGDRGIKVCARWLKFGSFLADMGECPRGMSIDRINNDGNYEPSNCRWATDKEQIRNRSITRTLTISGETLPVASWGERSGVPYKTIKNRLERGWSAHRAVFQGGVRA